MTTRDMIGRELPALWRDFDVSQRQAVDAANAVIGHLRLAADRLQGQVADIKRDMLTPQTCDGCGEHEEQG